MAATPDADPLADPPASRALREFVELWGEMASSWGINRTMAQIHALLYASAVPLDTDEIMARLQISRGNANINLRALVDWTLVRKVQKPGSRKDYYEAETDVWTITTTIIEERRKREIQPVQRALAAVAADLRTDAGAPPAERLLAERVAALTQFMDVFDGFSRALLPLLRSRSAEKVHRVVQYAARLRQGRASGRDR